MGEQAAAAAPDLANMANHQTIYEAFKLLSDGHVKSPETILRDHLKSVHPTYEVTLTSHGKCDLLGYVGAGLATRTRTSEDLFDCTRKYQAPKSRLSREPGHLEDHNRFLRYSYHWNNFSYIIYDIEYYRSVYPSTLRFILSPQENVVGEDEKSATDQLLMVVGAWTADLHDEIYVFDDTCWEKSPELWASVRGASWDDVILDPFMKANLIEDVQGFFNNQALYKSLAVPWKRGIILHGVPGNGKTISIKAIINAMGHREEPIPSLYVKSFDACQNKTQKYSISEIFSHARIMAPCLLIFEDLDSLVTPETRSYFLNEVDGLEPNDGILMVGSTNHLDLLDPAISKRPSRFDRKYHFKLPNEDERAAYCEFWRRKLIGSDMVDFHEDLCRHVAKLSEGFSFAYLKELFVISLLTIANGAVTPVENEEERDGSEGTEAVFVEREPELKDNEKVAENEVMASRKGKEEKKDGVEKIKKLLPDLRVPESLKDNLLLKVLKAQLQILLDEMDNSDAGNSTIKRKHKNDDNDAELSD